MVSALQRLGCPKLSCWYFGSTLGGADGTDGTVGNGKPWQKDGRSWNQIQHIGSVYIPWVAEKIGL